MGGDVLGGRREMREVGERGKWEQCSGDVLLCWPVVVGLISEPVSTEPDGEG